MTLRSYCSNFLITMAIFGAIAVGIEFWDPPWNVLWTMFGGLLGTVVVLAGCVLFVVVLQIVLGFFGIDSGPKIWK